MNAIAALGLKPKNLYKQSLKEFIEENPELKKQRKEIQQQRYELYDQERLNNIERCIAKRNEIISHSKKVVPRKFNYEEELEGEDNYNNNIDMLKYKIRNTDDNYVIRRDFSAGKKKENELFEKNKNKILVTDNSYVMRDSMGHKAEIKKEDLEGVTCLKDEKKKLMEKAEKKDGQLMRYLKAEIEREKKIKMFKKRQEKNEKNLKKFNDFKQKQLKAIENDRYKDNQNIYERQKLLEKFFSQNELDLNSQNINNLNINLNSLNTNLSATLPNSKTNPNLNQVNDNKLKKEKSESKMETLKKQIQDYEKKNEEFKQKIVNMFELKDKDEIKQIIKKNKKPENNSQKMKSTDYIKKKLGKIEDQFEVEKYRREMALMNNMNNYQNKINKILLYREKKEERIKNTRKNNEKEREKKIDERNIILDKTRKNKIINAEKNEEKRKKLIEDIEKNELRNYAIKEEKKKLYEERKKMNKLNEEEREEMKIKIRKIINNEKSYNENEKSEDIIGRMMKEKNEE